MFYANFFGFYSPTLEGFTGVGHSIEDCIYKARFGGMKEHVELLRDKGLPVPSPELNPSSPQSRTRPRFRLPRKPLPSPWPASFNERSRATWGRA